MIFSDKYNKIGLPKFNNLIIGLKQLYYKANGQQFGVNNMSLSNMRYLYLIENIEEMKSHDWKQRIIKKNETEWIQSPLKLSQLYDSFDVCPGAQTLMNKSFV